MWCCRARCVAATLAPLSCFDFSPPRAGAPRVGRELLRLQPHAASAGRRQCRQPVPPSRPALLNRMSVLTNAGRYSRIAAPCRAADVPPGVDVLVSAGLILQLNFGNLRIRSRTRARWGCRTRRGKRSKVTMIERAFHHRLQHKHHTTTTTLGKCSLQTRAQATQKSRCCCSSARFLCTFSAASIALAAARGPARARSS